MIDGLVAPPLMRRSPDKVNQQQATSRKSPGKAVTRMSPTACGTDTASIRKSSGSHSEQYTFNNGDLPAFEGIVSMVVKYLTATELGNLLKCNRDWRTFDAARFCLPYLYKLTFDDIKSITAIHSNSITSMSSSPRHMRRLRKLDLTQYTAPLAAGQGARTPPRPRKAAKDSIDSRPGSSPQRSTHTCPLPAEEWLQQYVQHKPSLQQLQTLSVGPLMPRWMVDACLTGVSLQAPGTLSRLTALSMKDCAKVDDRLLSCLSSCPTLRVLDLRGCWRVTPTALLALMQACPSVHKAMLGGMTRIDDSVLQSLHTRWPCLSVLDLSCESRSWSALGLATLLAKHSALTHVRVAHAGAGFGAEQAREAVAQERGGEEAGAAAAIEEPALEGAAPGGGAVMRHDDDGDAQGGDRPAFNNGWQLVLHALAQLNVRSHMRTMVLQDCVGCLPPSPAASIRSLRAHPTDDVEQGQGQAALDLEQWYTQQCREAEKGEALPTVSIVHIADESTVCQW